MTTQGVSGVCKLVIVVIYSGVEREKKELMGNIEFFTSKRDRDKRHESTQTSSPSTRSPPGNSDQLRAYAMFFRIRFIVIRSCVISFILVLLVQLLGWFKDGIDRVYKSRKLLREERAFWNEIAKEDSHVTDEQRFQFIQSVQEDGVHTSVNWTSILNDSYQRKAVRHELTETTDRYKHRFEDEHAPVAQRIFHVFEETKVSAKILLLHDSLVRLGVHSTEILLVTASVSSAVSLQELPVDL